MLQLEYRRMRTDSSGWHFVIVAPQSLPLRKRPFEFKIPSADNEFAKHENILKFNETNGGLLHTAVLSR